MQASHTLYASPELQSKLTNYKPQRTPISINLLLAADPTQQLLPIAVSRQTDPRRDGPLDTRPPLPPLEVEPLDAHLLLQRRPLAHILLRLLAVRLPLVLDVAPRVVRPLAPEDADGDPDDHGEPEERDGLQEEQGRDEGPLHRVVEAHEPVLAVEGLEEVRQAAVGGMGQGAGQVGVRAREARVGHRAGYVRPGGVADCQVEHVSRHEPGEHEQAEGGIAEGGEAEVFETFGYLGVVLGTVGYGGGRGCLRGGRDRLHPSVRESGCRHE